MSCNFDQLYQKVYETMKLPEHTVEAFWEDMGVLLTDYLLDTMHVNNLYLLFHAWTKYALIEQEDSEKRQAMLVRAAMVNLLTPESINLPTDKDFPPFSVSTKQEVLKSAKIINLFD